MTTTPNKALNEPANSSLNWDVPLNANFTNIDAAFGAQQVFNVGGVSGNINVSGTVFIGSYPANTPSYIAAIWGIVGTPSGNITLTIPSGIGGIWVINNQMTGSYTLTVASGGAGASVVLSNGSSTTIWSDGTNVYLANTAASGGPIGSILIWAGPSLVSNYFYCDGAAVSRTTYSALYAAVGTTWGIGNGSTTFNLPNLNGVAPAGADNMGGTPAGVFPGLDLGVTAGAVNQTLSIAQLPSHNHNDLGHNHGASDSGHTHTIPAAAGTSLGAVGAGTFFASSSAGNTGTGHANVSISTGFANISYTGSGNPVSVAQPTAGVNYLIRYQ